VDVQAFRNELRKRAIGPGAVWRRADFHVHVPGSSDYEYRNADAVERLGRVLEDGRYAFAVILKHQEFPSREELESLQGYCPSVTLVPGAEINVVVDALFKKIGKDYFFHTIVAVDPALGGDYGYVLRKAQESLTYRPGDYPAGFRSNILDVSRFFRENDALIIPAHLHQAKAPHVSKSIDDLYEDDAFLGFLADGAFDAVEVRQLSTAAFFDGTKKTVAGKDIPRATCVASSDAHHHDHIAQRQRETWLRAERSTFSELRAALSFPHRVSLSRPAANHPRVVGMHVVGAFIQDAWILFNEGLNALIGSKGAGKTALLECLRFGLNTPVPGERIESVRRHLAHVLGAAGYVECLVTNQAGEDVLITRRLDSPDRITIIDGLGHSKVVAAHEHLGFPISILGWHEIEEVADKASARIGLLDRIGDHAAIRRKYEHIGQQVERARDQLPLLQRQIKRLDAALKELWELQRKRATLARLEQGDLLALQQQYEWFLLTEQKLDGLRAAAERRRDAVPDAVTSRVVVDLGAAPAVEGAVELTQALDEVVSALSNSRLEEENSIGRLQQELARIAGLTKGAGVVLTAAFARFRESTYNPKVNALPPEDREILAKQILVLEETKRLPVVEQHANELLREVKDLSSELHAICDDICQAREEIVALRGGLVATLNSSLTSVRLRFLRSANHEARDRFQSRYGTEGTSLVSYLQGFGKPEAYQNLRAVFGKLHELELSADRWDINDTFWDVKFVDLLNVLDEDDVEVALAVGKAGFVPIQNLSAGQRCVAVFPLLLRNTRGPLVIDQPEDNLDNRYIADVIAPDLLRRKQEQQFAVTSHNANLVVLTDADLVVHVDSDGASSSFPAAGFLSCVESGVRQSVLDVLDGGDAALRARQRKYGARS
jgi:DNA repair ATPase RecN